MLSADGRVVTAVDVGTGDAAVLMKALGPVRSMAVGNNGELVRVDGFVLMCMACVGWVRGGGGGYKNAPNIYSG